jgi:hypothetical protein
MNIVDQEWIRLNFIYIYYISLNSSKYNLHIPLKDKYEKLLYYRYLLYQYS